MWVDDLTCQMYFITWSLAPDPWSFPGEVRQVPFGGVESVTTLPVPGMEDFGKEYLHGRLNPMVPPTRGILTLRVHLVAFLLLFLSLARGLAQGRFIIYPGLAVIQAPLSLVLVPMILDL